MGFVYASEPKEQPDRRRRYVVTLLREGRETAAQTDARLVAMLGVDREHTKVTASVYEPATNDFKKLPKL